MALVISFVRSCCPARSPSTVCFTLSLHDALPISPEALRAWRDWAREVPESVTTSAAFVQVPPDAPLPEPVRGKLVLSLRVSHVGDADEGERLLAQLRVEGNVLA